jgi:hypothetical protein
MSVRCGARPQISRARVLTVTAHWTAPGGEQLRLRCRPRDGSGRVLRTCPHRRRQHVRCRAVCKITCISWLHDVRHRSDPESGLRPLESIHGTRDIRSASEASRRPRISLNLRAANSVLEASSRGILRAYGARDADTSDQHRAHRTRHPPHSHRRSGSITTTRRET